MKWTKDQLRAIYDRTQGKCHICHTKRAFKNHGVHGAKGSWQVEHSHPQAKGGSHHGNNLYVACISCNASKGARSTRSSRAMNGCTRAPLSAKAEAKARGENAVVGGGIGAAIGALLAGPPGAWLGGLIGAGLGAAADPEADQKQGKRKSA